jgi:hypothetical protein
MLGVAEPMVSEELRHEQVQHHAVDERSARSA